MKIKNALDTFASTGKLPSKFINCSKCDCNVTAFGTNLDGKIKKYGTLENLLLTFICRKCSSASKPEKVKKTVVKKHKNKSKQEKEEVVYDIPVMKGFVPTNAFLKDTPALVREMTTFSCVSPAHYLNNGRKCTGCIFHANCNCALKKALA